MGKELEFLLYRLLGETKMEVSRLCFGALTIGSLQANLPLAEGAGVIRSALSQGVNFIDTAELYDTYKYIRQAIQGFEAGRYNCFQMLCLHL